MAELFYKYYLSNRYAPSFLKLIILDPRIEVLPTESANKIASTLRFCHNLMSVVITDREPKTRDLFRGIKAGLLKLSPGTITTLGMFSGELRLRLTWVILHVFIMLQMQNNCSHFIFILKNA